MQVKLRQTYRIPQPAGAVVSVSDEYGFNLIALGVADAVEAPADEQEKPVEKPAIKAKTQKKR